MSEIVVFDSSVLIDQMRTNRHLHRMSHLDSIVRTSSVVLAELGRGATTSEEQQFLREIAEAHPILTPTTKNWLESGKILAKIRKDNGFEPSKLRDLHFDVLIALTARSHGAKLITTNRADFELIREYRDYALEVW
ncbi:MAG TPA: type II toxin-antitoxin system VapC family toxin [Terracidiphilus sp.]|jgi:predicted nucleic acid-binding protein|nr:type II toxin-antitoxin system VapC family toxin [Terracidiphilus sp.]